jgi:predicted pyridoxine 5'-phosphate oxidase superfamily flavin-nucleotide-binding protein
MEKGRKALEETWKNRKGPAVFATVDKESRPNAIYVGDVFYEPETGIIVADNYFHKTRENIKNGSRGSILFLTGEGKSYQVKGSIDYHSEGQIFEDMKKWHNSKHPGVAAAVLVPEEIYSGAERIA